MPLSGGGKEARVDRSPRRKRRVRHFDADALPLARVRSPNGTQAACRSDANLRRSPPTAPTSGTEALGTEEVSRTVALIYSRVSKLDARAVSPEMQLERCKELPALRGLAIEHYEDLDISGKNTKRPGYQAMVERIARGDVAIVAAYSLSRISRSVRDFYVFHEEVLKPTEVAFVSATEAIDTSSPQGRAFMGMTAVWAQMERELVSERTRDATAQKISSGGIVGTIPAGYKRSAGGIEIDPEPADTIRMIFREYATGRHGFGTLARWLNAQGVKPPRSPDLNGRPMADLFADETVRQFVSNPRYAGYVERLTGELVPGTHSPLIDETTWAACLRIRRSGFRSWLDTPSRRRTAWALTKILLCPTCAGPMRGDSRIREKRRHGYYSCLRHRKDPRACSQRPLRQTEIEAAVRALLSLVAVPADLSEAFRDAIGVEQRPRRGDQVRGLERRIADLDWRQENELIQRDDYADKRRRLVAELEDLRVQPDNPTSLLARRTELRTLVDDWDSASTETRRALISSVFESIQPTQDGGLVGQARRGSVRHVAAAALATSVNVSAYGADPGARTRNRWFTKPLLYR